MQATLHLEAHYRWPALRPSADQSPVFAAGELFAGVAQQEHKIAVFLEPGRASKRQIVEQTDHADHRRWWDVPFAGFVVQTDIAAHHRQLECPTGIRQAAYALLKLAEHEGSLGVAEVEAIRHRQWSRAATDDVASGLGHGRFRALVWIEGDVPGVAVGRQRQPLGGARHAQERRIEAGPPDGVVLNLMVVGAKDRSATP